MAILMLLLPRQRQGEGEDVAAGAAEFGAWQALLTALMMVNLAFV